MAHETLHKNFVPIGSKGEIELLNKKVSEWINLTFKSTDLEVKVQSLSNTAEGLLISFPGLTPANKNGVIEFELLGNSYQVQGDLTPAEGGFIFKPQAFFREQKRKLIRMSVPEGYPAHFIIEKIGGESHAKETRILDIHNEGIQIYCDEKLPLSMGARIEGTVKIKKFPDVKVSGQVRYYDTKSPNTVAGIELSHLDFGSEDKLRELLLFFRHDVFYFNKNKASGKS